MKLPFPTYNKEKQIAGVLEKLIPFLIGIYMFFNPFPHTTAIKEICFYLASAIVLGLWVFRKKTLFFDTPLFRALLLFLAWVVLTTPFAVDKANTVHDIYSHLIRYIWLYVVIINYFDTEEKMERLVWIIIISSAIFVCWAMYYYYFTLDHNFSRRLATGKVGALAQVPIHVIGFIALFAFILSVNNFIQIKKYRTRLLLVVCMFFLEAAIFLSQSRGIIVALVVSVIVFLSLRNKKVMLIAFCVFTLLLVLLTPVKARFKKIFDSPRIGIYYTMIEIIKDHPFTGIGFGMQSYFKLDADAYDKKITDESKKLRIGRDRRLFINDPHNWAIGLLVRTGFVGLGLYLYIIYSSLNMALKVLKTKEKGFYRDWGLCSLILLLGFLIIGLFQPTFTHMVEVQLYSLFSILTIVWRLGTKAAER